MRRHDRLEHDQVQTVLDELTADGDHALAAEGFGSAERRFERTADLRYFGQAFEVRVDVPEGRFDTDLADATAARFHAEHRALYGYDFADDPTQQVEWVNLRVTGVGPIRRPDLRTTEPGDGAESARTGTRDAYFGGWTNAALYQRERLGAGDVVEGPAVIEEFGSTIPVHPGFRAEVDGFGNVLVTRDVEQTEEQA